MSESDNNHDVWKWEYIPFTKDSPLKFGKVQFRNRQRIYFHVLKDCNPFHKVTILTLPWSQEKMASPLIYAYGRIPIGDELVTHIASFNVHTWLYFL